MGKSKRRNASQKSECIPRRVPADLRPQLNSLVETLLQKCTSLSTSNSKQEWDEYLSIQNLLSQIIEIEKDYGLRQRKRNTNWAELISWCTENGAKIVDMEIRESEEDYGIFATDDFQEGESFLYVPRKLMLSTEAVTSSKLGPLCEKDPILQHMPNVVLAMQLLLECCKDDSFWKPYISSLPVDYTTPLYFTPEEMEELRGSPVLDDALKMCRNIARQYAYFHRVFQMDSQARELPFQDAFTYEMYRWAVSTVMTRQNQVPSSDGDQMITALVPLWDMCNHSNGKFSTDYSVENNWLECFAMRSYKKDEQIYIFYGVRPNSELFVHNGFVYPENENDALTLKLGVSKSDPLFSQKSQLCTKLGLPVSGVFFLCSGKEPIDRDLLAFVRIFLMKSEELKAWLSRDDVSALLVTNAASGDEATKNALMFLKTRCHLLLKSYPTTLEEDTKLLNTHPSPHRRLTVQLRISEKTILNNTLKAIETYLKPPSQ